MKCGGKLQNEIEDLYVEMQVDSAQPEDDVVPEETKLEESNEENEERDSENSSWGN